MDSFRDKVPENLKDGLKDRVGGVLGGWVVKLFNVVKKLIIIHQKQKVMLHHKKNKNPSSGFAVFSHL